MAQPLLRRVLAPIVQLRDDETLTAALMFIYSFLAIASYNIVKPITKSKFIEGLGADNLPYVIIGSSVIIGILMQGYSRLMSILPRRWAISITQAAMAVLFVVFWFLFQTKEAWVSVAFYFFGLILGVLLISQFWTLANLIYDARQAKRLFGFVGGGAPLGGILASALLAGYTKQIGTVNFLLVSAAFMAVCAVVVAMVVARENPQQDAAQPVPAAAGKEESIGAGEAAQLLRRSRHLQIISLVIAFAAIGASIIDQQLSMATEAFKGRAATDSMTQFLAQVQLWMSSIAFLIQIWLTSRIHRLLGIGFALMVLPVSLGTTGLIMLFNAALWAPALARIVDQSLRYTVDKTTREILFLPLPNDIKYKAKPFVDVTVDRFAKGTGGLLALILIKPWGLSLTWQQVSYASLGITLLWIGMAIQARRGYLAAFRRSIERRDMEPAEVRLNVADLSTIETLMEELASPDERRVVYAIDILESLEKRNLITPLLLYHEAPAVRARALTALGRARREIAERWLPAIQRMIADDSPEVRAAAVSALANIRNEQATELIRPYLHDRDPRIATTAAVVLARSGREEDVTAAEDVLTQLASDARELAVRGRRDAATAIRQIPDPRFRHLLIPLLYDPEPEVAAEAMQSVREIGSADFLFVPTLVSLLRHRQLKASAREVLVSYGEEVVDALAHFLRDPDEDIWVRRHIPATLARIPCQKTMNILVAELNDPDGFVRYKVLAALETLRRDHPELTFNREPIEALVLKEAARCFNYLTLQYNLFAKEKLSKESLLDSALKGKLARTVDRIYRLLGLIYPWKDVAAARWAIERGDARGRASAAEYLDNLLTGSIRKRVMPLLEDLPLDEKVRRANVLLKTRPRGVEETLLQLINDDDPVVSAAAIDLVSEQKLWTLADDLEHVLQFRDVKDWYVFEAASWALAVYRVPEDKRRQLWLEPLPAVELAARLRHFPVFASVSVDELFRIAGTGRQIRHESGRTLFHEGMVPDNLQFLLDGKVSIGTRSGELNEAGPPAAFAFEEVLQGSPMVETVRTVETSVCLALTRDEIRTLLADNTELVQGLFRMLVDRRRAASRLVSTGGSASEIALLEAGGLKPIEKVLVLQQIPTFAEIPAEQMLHLASITRDVRLTPDSTLFTESDPAALYAVMAGELLLESGGQPPVRAAAGDVVGLYETLAGLAPGRHAVVKREGRALRIRHEDLFDLLGHSPELLQHLFSALLRAEAPEVVAAS